MKTTRESGGEWQEVHSETEISKEAAKEVLEAVVSAFQSLPKWSIPISDPLYLEPVERVRRGLVERARFLRWSEGHVFLFVINDDGEVHEWAYRDRDDEKDEFNYIRFPNLAIEDK